MKVYRAMLKMPSRDWTPLNGKLYLKRDEVERLIRSAQNNSDFFRWGDEFKVQEAEIREEMFTDVQ